MRPAGRGFAGVGEWGSGLAGFAGAEYRGGADPVGLGSVGARVRFVARSGRGLRPAMDRVWGLAAPRWLHMPRASAGRLRARSRRGGGAFSRGLEPSRLPNLEARSFRDLLRRLPMQRGARHVACARRCRVARVGSKSSLTRAARAAPDADPGHRSPGSHPPLSSVLSSRLRTFRSELAQPNHRQLGAGAVDETS